MSTKRINFIILIILLILVSLFSCKDFRIYCIMSGSMEPTISPGSIILVDLKTEPHVEDIVTFQTQDTIITHRLKKQINDQKYITKGDANHSDDPIPLFKAQIIGKVIIVIPFIGYIVIFLRRYLWLLCAAFLMFMYIMKERKKLWNSMNILYRVWHC